MTERTDPAEQIREELCNIIAICQIVAKQAHEMLEPVTTDECEVQAILASAVLAEDAPKGAAMKAITKLTRVRDVIEGAAEKLDRMAHKVGLFEELERPQLAEAETGSLAH